MKRRLIILVLGIYIFNSCSKEDEDFVDEPDAIGTWAWAKTLHPDGSTMSDSHGYYYWGREITRNNIYYTENGVRMPRYTPEFVHSINNHVIYGVDYYDVPYYFIYEVNDTVGTFYHHDSNGTHDYTWVLYKRKKSHNFLQDY